MIRTRQQIFAQAICFDAATEETFVEVVSLPEYTNGPVRLDIHWYRDTADEGEAIWSATLEPTEPNSDIEHGPGAWPSISLIRKSPDQRSEILMEGKPGLLVLRITRRALDGRDTMWGDAAMTMYELTYE